MDDAEVVTPSSRHDSDAAAPEHLKLNNDCMYICGAWSRSRTQATSKPSSDDDILSCLG